MKNIFISILIFQIVFISLQANASSINASSFGYNATDATAAFASAINATVDTVIIDFAGNGDWVITSTSFFDISNKTIIFKPGVRLVAKPGAFSADVQLLKFVRGLNIKLSGYGATFIMQKAEYTTGEFRHTLQLENCKGIIIEGLIFKDSGGDGIYLGGENSISPTPYCENVLVKDCVMDNNRRQGMSVISAQNLLVTNCLFKNTKGTLPEAGVDLEPYETYQRIVNCNFKKCQFVNNNGHGIDLAFFYMDNTSQPVSVNFEECYLSNNHVPANSYEEAEIYASVKCASPVIGSVDFNNCLVENSQWTAFGCRKTSNSVQVNFSNSVFKNVSQAQILYNNPIWIEICDYALPNQGFGGVNFNNVLIDYSSNMGVIGTYGEPSPAAGLQNITGNLFVHNPTYNIPSSFNNINSFVNVTYSSAYLSTLPAQAVSINAANGNNFYEKICNKALINIDRITTTNTMPLAVKYNTSGTATNADDYCQMPLFKIIKANENNAVDTILYRDDNTMEPLETLNYNLQNNSGYTTSSPTSLNYTLQDQGICSSLPIKQLLLKNVSQKSDKTISINWETEDEINNHFFSIEKSTAGTSFEKIGTQFANGNTIGKTNYTFTDVTENKSNILFYRIKQTDINGSFAYSNILKFAVKNNSVSISPNPAHDIVFINSLIKIKNYIVYNIEGKICIQNNNKNNSIEVSFLPKGMYIIKLLDKEGNWYVQKLVKE